MKHLTDEERLTAARESERPHPHLAECVVCRTEVERLTGTLDRLREVEIPEPSPLFWEHLTARIVTAASEERLPARGWWERFSWRLALPVAATLGVLATAVGLTLVRPVPVATPSAQIGVQREPAQAAPATLDPAESEPDEAWTLLQQLSEVEETADGDGVDSEAWGPISSEGVVAALTEPEREALTQLLEQELEKGTPVVTQREQP